MTTGFTVDRARPDELDVTARHMQLYPHDFSQIAPPSARAIDTFASRAAGGRHDLSFPVTADKDGSAKARP